PAPAGRRSRAAAARRRRGRRWPAARGRGSRPRRGTRRSSRDRDGAGAATGPATGGAAPAGRRRAAARRCRRSNTWNADSWKEPAWPDANEKSRTLRCGPAWTAWYGELRLAAARCADTIVRRAIAVANVRVADGLRCHGATVQRRGTALQQLQT